jgi:hypothetical protein
MQIGRFQKCALTILDASIRSGIETPYFDGFVTRIEEKMQPQMFARKQLV